MSRTKPTDVEIIGLEEPCDYCAARPGVWCTAGAGAYRWAEYLHGARSRPISSAYQLGARESEATCAKAAAIMLSQPDSHIAAWWRRKVEEARTA